MRIVHVFIVILLGSMGTLMKSQGLDRQKLDKILQSTVNGKSIFGATLSIGREGEMWTGAAGNIKVQQAYFIASTTKLYVTAIVLHLREQEKLRLDDPISTYLSPELLQGLHVYKGQDYSAAITIQQLLAQTSGLSNYFEDKPKGERSLLEAITQGNDQTWTFEEAIERTKRVPAKFAPGAKGKAHYSDTNFQLLGKIIEQVTGMKFQQACVEYLFNKLALTQTYVYTDSTDSLPVPLYYKNRVLHIPKAMSSFGADGGIVSTSEESLTFLKAFFEGRLFPKEYLTELYDWNRIMFPLEYGIGVMRFKLPRIFSPFKPIPAFIGHSGLSGAFSYYVPEKQVYLAGTVNQVHDPSLSYKMMMKVLNTLP